MIRVSGARREWVRSGASRLEERFPAVVEASDTDSGGVFLVSGKNGEAEGVIFVGPEVLDEAALERGNGTLLVMKEGGGTVDGFQLGFKFECFKDALFLNALVGGSGGLVLKLDFEFCELLIQVGDAQGLKIGIWEWASDVVGGERRFLGFVGNELVLENPVLKVRGGFSPLEGERKLNGDGAIGGLCEEVIESECKCQEKGGA